MPRIGLVSDIHGNLVALDAVLAELEQEGVDGLVCLGDVAAGPQPRETLARVQELGCPVVMGNWDAWFIERPAPPPPEDEIATILYEINAFWADQLTHDDRAVLGGYAPRLDLPLEGGERALCFHGSPRSYDDFIFATTPDEELAAMLGNVRRPLLIGGHTHLQLVRRFEHSLFVNPGAVGLPFSDWWPDRVLIAPRAEYGVLFHDDGQLRVDLRRTTYDVQALLRLTLESGMPHAQWWVDCWTEGRPSPIYT
jgi:predicted phosphodiesterase